MKKTVTIEVQYSTEDTRMQFKGDLIANRIQMSYDGEYSNKVLITFIGEEGALNQATVDIDVGLLRQISRISDKEVGSLSSIEFAPLESTE